MRSLRASRQSEQAARPSLVRQGLRRALATTLPRRLLLVGGPARCGSVCLTFDDGPHPEHTPRLLDLLAEHRIPATFFVIGERARKHPELIERIVDEGHALGNHSYSHTEPRHTTARQLLEDVQRADRLLLELTGRSTTLVRPPHGKVTAAKLALLWFSGQTVVLWNRDPKDFRCGSAEQLGDWFRENPPVPGGLVLLHDNHPHAVLALPSWIDDARRRGLTFATPTDWLSGPPRVTGPLQTQRVESV